MMTLITTIIQMLISPSHDNHNSMPQVGSYDDWSDVYHIIEFEKKSKSLNKQSSHNDNRDRGGCVFIICLVIAVVLFNYFLRFYKGLFRSYETYKNMRSNV